MRSWVRPLLGASLLLLLALSDSSGQGGKGKPGPGKPGTGKPDSLHSSLRDVINHGAELFNEYGDYAGCYRLYQGALISIRPQLAQTAPELLQDVDETLKKAESIPRIADRAFALRGALDRIRERFRPDDVGKKPDDKKPDDKKPDDKKPDDKKPDKKPDDKKPDDKKPDDKKPDDKKPDDKKKVDTLWKRLGGEPGITQVVDDFVRAAADNPKVNVTRDGKFKLDEKGVEDLKRKLVEFISQNTGGPLKYTGKSMKEAHRGMAVTDAEFDAAGAEMKKVLKEAGVKTQEIDELMKIIGSTRKDIVEPPAKKKVDPDDEPKKKPDEPKKVDDNDKKKKVDPDEPVEKKVDQKKKAEPKEKAVPKDTGNVEGKVTVNGKPGATGYITLTGSDQRSFATYVGPEGTFSFRTPLPLGRYRISFEPGTKEGAKSSAIQFPERYVSPETSQLTAEVSTGQNAFAFELKGK